jgi:four helix bundle protein
MFDFEKLEVYKRAKEFNSEISVLLFGNKVDRIAKDQLKRASLSIALNIAEGSSRFSKPDRKNFLVIARGSLFECVAIRDILREQQTIDVTEYQKFYAKGDELSRMIFAMIRHLQLSNAHIA